MANEYNIPPFLQEIIDNITMYDANGNIIGEYDANKNEHIEYFDDYEVQRSILNNTITITKLTYGSYFSITLNFEKT
ncbi:MAG: hypothetical protein AAFO15_01995 [Pseudomonadota bacterium]